ncbi:MAG: OmpA family protein [Cytophaga sp.]|uniref:OmpA family protein n=1 Tax=Cytophaga sp. TaxID=29535 RepID=UPI003F81EAAF
MKYLFALILLVSSLFSSHAQSFFTLQDSAFVKGAVLRKSILFGYDSFSILPESLPFLDSLTVFLNKNKRLQIEVGNHSDERGSAAYSRNLTAKRAAAIVAYLISKGVDANRLSAKGYNASKPVIVHAKTEAEHQQNRRTEFMILRTDYTY